MILNAKAICTRMIMLPATSKMECTLHTDYKEKKLSEMSTTYQQQLLNNIFYVFHVKNIVCQQETLPKDVLGRITVDPVSSQLAQTNNMTRVRREIRRRICQKISHFFKTLAHVYSVSTAADVVPQSDRKTKRKACSSSIKQIASVTSCRSTNKQAN